MATSEDVGTLDRYQQAAVAHGDGPAIVVAGPRVGQDARHRRARRQALWPKIAGYRFDDRANVNCSLIDLFCADE